MTELSLELGLDEVEEPARLRELASQKLGCAPSELPPPVVLKRSIDARKGRVRFVLLVSFDAKAAEILAPLPREVRRPARVIIVGDGPAGLFCAYALARSGIASTIVDRGKQVQPRRRDLKSVNQHGTVDPDSNYCFGEGGAGTYSDGKLYTRSHKRGNVRDVLEILVQHGAPEAILSDARPHIGSNRLPKVVTALRERLEACGVEFRFEARLVDILTTGTGGDRRVRGVRLADGAELEGEAVVLATGHSARDVLKVASQLGVELEPKAFAMGVRIEHPQPLINQIQYGRAAGHPKLPAASYRLAGEYEGRGVFSFCMCPGGFVVPATTAASEVVVNGMSLSRRDSPFANSGLVVSVEPQDLLDRGVMAGVELQRKLEQLAFAAGGGGFRAPATRATDFVAGRASSTVPKTSYQPGLTAGDVREVLNATGLTLSQRLGAAMKRFGRQLRGYLSEEAVLIGVESRTSSPVRMVRDPATLCSTTLTGLYPCGEGAGYAGGIVSAAMDGMRVAAALAQVERITKP